MGRFEWGRFFRSVGPDLWAVAGPSFWRWFGRNTWCLLRLAGGATRALVGGRGVGATYVRAFFWCYGVAFAVLVAGPVAVAVARDLGSHGVAGTVAGVLAGSYVGRHRAIDGAGGAALGRTGDDVRAAGVGAGVLLGRDVRAEL